MKISPYKKIITDLLTENHFLSIADIHSCIPEADYSTIYRNIEQLLEDKKIKKILLDQKTSLYELIHEHEHDHFICDTCGDVTEINLPRKKLAISLPISDITIRGRCGNCVSC